ncbi:hypothetical protein OPV22_035019 [Ensete ventricosum]|uniref:Amino acid transporter transmembrane domain-containing protein n=1 Tax=Ensete ventricosum TaxID=4639 RepID=A0AAV8NZR2_ENSVE|nr:hypothetical protein OPV22_035019 [Ensete ventricosum]
MVEMHEMVPGKRFDRSHEHGQQHAFGDKLGLWIVVPQQLVVEVGVNIVYMVTGGKSLKKFHDVVCPDCNLSHLLHHDLRLRPLGPLSAPQLQFRLRSVVPGRSRHVPQVLAPSACLGLPIESRLLFRLILSPPSPIAWGASVE